MRRRAFWLLTLPVPRRQGKTRAQIARAMVQALKSITIALAMAIRMNSIF